MKIYTKSLTSGSFTIDAAKGVLLLSFKTAASSSCTFSGDGTFGTDSSETQSFGASDGLTLTSQNPQSPLQGVTITWVSGTVNIICGVT